MLRFHVDLSDVKSWAEFVAAFNKGFIKPVGGEGWEGNLDALNDYLWWPSETPYRLVIDGWEKCRRAVNEHKSFDGRPVLDVVMEIFRDNPQAEVAIDY